MSVSMSGSLEKAGEKGLVKRCKTRWFEVVGSHMNYYKSRGDPMIGYIDLATATDVLPTTKMQAKSGYGFEIRTPDRVWFLYSETQAEQELWVSHLREIIDSRFKPQAASSSPSLHDSRKRGTVVATNDVANGDAEPPPVPAKPSFVGSTSSSTFGQNPKMPPKTPLKKMPPPVPKVGSSPNIAVKKVGGPGPPLPKGFGNSRSDTVLSASDGTSSPGIPKRPNAYANGVGESSTSDTGTAPPTAGTLKTRPPVPKVPANFKRPPPKPPGPGNVSGSSDPSAQEDMEPVPTFSVRRNSAFRATTGDITTSQGGPSVTPSGIRPGHVSVAPPNTTLTSPPSTPTGPAPPSSTNTEKRTKTAKELLQTEKYYVDCLHALQQDFMQPLLESAKQPGEIHNDSDVRSMFSNILPMIIPVNEELLQGLEKRMSDASWDPNKTLIGDVFVAIGPFLKMYLEYSRNYQSGIETYNRLKENATFSTKLVSMKDRSKVKLALEHLLIMPVQRIPRYLLLLGEIKKETGGDHPDRAQLEKAIGLLEDVANHINEQMKRLEVGNKFLAYPELVAPHRYLMWEGTVETRIDKEKEEAKFVLFNDMLLHHAAKKATKGSKWHLQPENCCSIQLVWTAAASVTVKENSAAIGPMEVIDLILPAKRMTVVASSVDERNFLKALREAMQRHHGSEQFPMDREAEHVFSEEATYRGSWREGKQHGIGTMEFKGIATFTGSWVNGMKQGQGTMAWVSGNTYDGSWMAGLPHGEGAFTWVNRDSYVGSFLEGLKSGKGTFTWASGATYVGDWVRDKPSGTGNYNSAVEVYEGGWLDGFFHGNGVLREKLTGRTFDGGWAMGLREGSGTCRYADGSEYTGSWKRNRREGKGTLTTRLGKGVETYTGDWADDRRNGFGTLTWADGSVYEGTFKDDLRHGKGKLKFSDSDPSVRLRYEGEFDFDRMSGKGTLWYQNGDMFDGSFKDNAFNGQGSYQYASSIKVEGKWTMGQLEGKGGIFQLVSPADKKPTHITGTFVHGSFARSKDASTKFEIPVAPTSTTINTTRL